MGQALPYVSDLSHSLSLRERVRAGVARTAPQQTTTFSRAYGLQPLHEIDKPRGTSNI